MKKSLAVLHLRTKMPSKVLHLAGKVHLNMTTNVEAFPQPDPTMEELDTELTKLGALLSSKDGRKVINQSIADQTDIVHRLLKKLCVYVNTVAKGDKMTIVLSGFDCSKDAATRPLPEKAVVKRIEDGKVRCSAKIYIYVLANANRYKVEITTDLNNPAGWRTVLDHGSLNTLEIGNLTYLQETYIRVTGGNTHGWGVPSEPVLFVPR
jgi:hypothetical protein